MCHVFIAAYGRISGNFNFLSNFVLHFLQLINCCFTSNCLHFESLYMFVMPCYFACYVRPGFIYMFITLSNT